MEDWLVKRLSDSQKESDRYVELAEALQTFWEKHFDPYFEDQENARSIYTASESDLKKRIAELGDRMSPDFPTEYDKPLAVAWRLYEIKRKDTSYLLKNSFRRNFGNLSVDWVRIYQDKRESYGDGFAAEIDLSDFEIANLYYLTSRGKIRADLGQIHKLGLTKDEFSTAATTIINKSRPAHIVYDGFIFYTSFEISVDVFPCDFSSSKKKIFPIPAMPRRFDYVAGDEKVLDTGNMSFTAKTETAITLAWEETSTRLDNYLLFDDIPADYCPLDEAIGPSM